MTKTGMTKTGMTKTFVRGLLPATVAALMSFAISAPALAASPARTSDEPAVVDKPDTSGLHNTWTFAPLGAPVFGLIDSVADVPKNLLPQP